MNRYDYLSNLYNLDILTHHRVLYIYLFCIWHSLYNLVQYIFFHHRVIHIYQFCLRHLLYNLVQYILFRHRVLYIYRFCLGHSLYNLVQFIYDVVIYKLKRYKSLRDLYLFNTSCSTTVFFTFMGFAYSNRFTIWFNTSAYFTCVYYNRIFLWHFLFYFIL